MKPFTLEGYRSWRSILKKCKKLRNLLRWKPARLALLEFYK